MWFTESSWEPIAALVVAAVASGFAWSRTGRKPFAALAALCVISIPVIHFVEKSIVTPAEEVEAKVIALRDAVVAGDVEKTLSFLSEGADTERLVIERALGIADVDDDLRITDMSVRAMGEDSQALSHFRANGTVAVKGYGQQHFATRWELSWRKEGGEWRVYKIARLDPIKGEPIPLLSGN